MLIPAAIVGVIVFLYGCATVDGNIPRYTHTHYHFIPTETALHFVAYTLAAARLSASYLTSQLAVNGQIQFYKALPLLLLTALWENGRLHVISRHNSVDTKFTLICLNTEV